MESFFCFGFCSSKGLAIRDKLFDGLKIRRDMASSIEQLRKLLGPVTSLVGELDIFDPLGAPPSLNKYLPGNETDILTWQFLSRAVYSTDSLNPRRRLDAALREGIDDVIRQLMEGINTLSKERGRIIDFKEVLYGYYRVNPKFGVDYILDILLVYKKYRGRKMTFPGNLNAIEIYFQFRKPILVPKNLQGHREREREEFWRVFDCAKFKDSFFYYSYCLSKLNRPVCSLCRNSRLELEFSIYHNFISKLHSIQSSLNNNFEL